MGKDAQGARRPAPTRCDVRGNCSDAGFTPGVYAHFTAPAGGSHGRSPSTRAFSSGAQSRFSCFSRAVGAAGFLCGPRNAVRMAGGNSAPASRPRVQSIEIESELTNTHLNPTETRRRPVEEPDARGAQRELPPSHQRRGSQGETKFQPRDPQSSKRDVPRHAEPSTDSPPLTPSRSSSGCASPS